jgi:hypothetical protein
MPIISFSKLRRSSHSALAFLRLANQTRVPRKIRSGRMPSLFPRKMMSLLRAPVERPSASESASRSRFLKLISDSSRPLSVVGAVIVVEAVAVEMERAAEAMDLSEDLAVTEPTVVAVVMGLEDVDVAMVLSEAPFVADLATAGPLSTLRTSTLSPALEHRLNPT